MKTYDFFAYAFDGAVYCAEHLPSSISADSPEVTPVFVSSEWDYYPSCDSCGKVFDYVSLTDYGRSEIQRQAAGQWQADQKITLTMEYVSSAAFYESHCYTYRLLKQSTGELVEFLYESDSKPDNVNPFDVLDFLWTATSDDISNYSELETFFTNSEWQSLSELHKLG
jgi:hypothetical protein